MNSRKATLPPLDEKPLVEDGIGATRVLRLNRPERKNALTRQLVLDLGDALEHAATDSSVRAVLLCGSGASFCSGADLSTITEGPREEIPRRIDEFHRLIRTIVGMDKPVVVAVDGPAVGFGADLALCADIRLMTNRAYLESSFTRVGLMPDGGGTLWMAEYLGPRAYEAIALGRRMDASDCLRLGLAREVTEPDALMGRAADLCRELELAAPLALASVKRNLRARQRARLEETLEQEKLGQSRLLASEDFQEGVQAFLQKRSPVFKGR